MDSKAAVRDGRLNLIDAQATLDGFMANSRPDRKRFDRSMGKLLTDAKQSARNGNYGLTVFGEMVALLWAQGNKQGALELEALWNDVLSERTFYLHCAYPRRAFSNEDESRLH